DQGVEGWMVEPFADELASRQQNARRIGGQRAQFCDKSGALSPGHPPVEHKWSWGRRTQSRPDGVEVLSSLCEDQHLAALIERLSRLCCDSCCARWVACNAPKYF